MYQSTKWFVLIVQKKGRIAKTLCRIGYTLQNEDKQRYLSKDNGWNSEFFEKQFHSHAFRIFLHPILATENRLYVASNAYYQPTDG